MTLVSISEVRALVQTSRNDAQIQTLIERVEADVVAYAGAHYVDTETSVTEVLDGSLRNLYLQRRVASITSVTEDDAILTSADYRLWAGQGRLERLPVGSRWGSVVEVAYVPADDTPRRKEVIIELVRLMLERTAMKAENVAGEYSYTAPDWETERARILRRLTFGEV